MFIIIIFWLGTARRLLFLLLSFRSDQSRDVTPRVTKCERGVTLHDWSLGRGWMMFYFRLFKFIFFLIKFHYVFSISYIALTYCIWSAFNTPLSCFFAGFLLFSPKGSVTGCHSSLDSLCYSPVHFMHLHSSYYYYDYMK